jgi:hypothetical protein
MVSVQLRNAGEGIWRAMSLPVSVQLAQTVAAAARTLKLADNVQIIASAPPPAPAGHVDVRV